MTFLRSFVDWQLRFNSIQWYWRTCTQEKGTVYSLREKLCNENTKVVDIHEQFF